MISFSKYIFTVKNNRCLDIKQNFLIVNSLSSGISEFVGRVYNFEGKV